MQAFQNCIFTFFVLFSNPVAAETNYTCSDYNNLVLDGRPIRLSNSLADMESDECFMLCNYLDIITYGYDQRRSQNSVCNQIYDHDNRVCNLAHYKLRDMREKIRAPVDRIRETRRASLMVRNTIHCSSLCDLIPTCSFAITRSRGSHGHVCQLLPALAPHRAPTLDKCSNCSCQQKDNPRRPHMFLS